MAGDMAGADDGEDFGDCGADLLACHVPAYGSPCAWPGSGRARLTRDVGRGRGERRACNTYLESGLISTAKCVSVSS